jgi:hypothetical protein
MLKRAAFLAASFVLLRQPAFAEVCLNGSSRDGSFITDMTSYSIDEVLRRDIEALGLALLDGRSRFSGTSAGASATGRPMLTTEYTYFLKPGQNAILNHIFREQPSKIDALFQKLKDRLPGAVCGHYPPPCDSLRVKPTDKFVRAGGELQYNVSFWSDWDASTDPNFHLLSLPLVTITSCEAP